MAIDEKIIGRKYMLAEPYDVSREKIREFARAVHSENLVHYDVDYARDHGYEDLVATGTFAIIVAQKADALLIGDAEAGIDFSRVVHAEQKFSYEREIIAGDRLGAFLEVKSVRNVASGSMVVTEAKIICLPEDDDNSDPDYEHVATTSSTIFVRADEVVESEEVK